MPSLPWKAAQEMAGEDGLPARPRLLRPTDEEEEEEEEEDAVFLLLPARKSQTPPDAVGPRQKKPEKILFSPQFPASQFC